MIEAGLQATVDELFDADWAEARARVGDDACGDDLDRSNSQRWHDAMIILLRHGIGADPTTANVVANVVADDQTLIDEAERRDAEASGQPAEPRSTADAVGRAATRRCETASGMPLAPADALDFATPMVDSRSPPTAKPDAVPCHRHKTRLETLGLWPPD